jgi:ATP synthase protein I
VTRPDDPPSNLSVGFRWASRVSTIGLEFAVPPVLGALLDRRWGTLPLATLVGVVLGFAVAMLHLLRIAREQSGLDSSRHSK